VLDQCCQIHNDAPPKRLTQCSSNSTTSRARSARITR
jgi:hypothetical protein